MVSDQHLTSQAIRQHWGETETVAIKVTKRRLEWLGHVARMSDHHIPKQVLFGLLPQLCPHVGPRRRWRDLIRRDLKNIGVKGGVVQGCYVQLQGQAGVLLMLALEDETTECHLPRAADHDTQTSQHQVECTICGRNYRRENDKTRHKCLAERQKPVSKQRGAVKCQ